MKLNQKTKPEHGMIRKILVFCPKCKSTNVNRIMAPSGFPNFGALLQASICNDCGFQDKIFPEIDESDKEILIKVQKIFRKKIKNKNKLK